jgi:hypothetical protein
VSNGAKVVIAAMTIAFNHTSPARNLLGGIPRLQRKVTRGADPVAESCTTSPIKSTGRAAQLSHQYLRAMLSTQGYAQPVHAPGCYWASQPRTVGYRLDGHPPPSTPKPPNASPVKVITN